jgi:hypothetical protein
MHLKALTSLRSFFLRFLGMSSLPPVENEFPGHISVQYWEVALLQRYCSRDLEQSFKNRSRMETLNVITIRRYKERRRVEHEYLIAEVSYPDLGQRRYLQIDAAEDPIRNQYTTERSSRHSHNCVATTAGWPIRDICIDKLDCRHTQMILLDLAIVVKVVNDHSDRYRLFKRQRFWYSDVIIGVLQENFPRMSRIRIDPSLVAEHAQDAEMEVLDDLSGTYMRVPIYHRRMSVIEETHDNFVKYSFHIRSLVNLLNMVYFFWLIITIDLRCRRGC